MRTYRSLLLPLMGACLFFIFGAQPVLAQDMQCQEELSQANAMYTTGRFDAAIERIDACLAKESISDMERRTAYRLKGLCFIGKGAEIDAKSSVRRLLEIIPNYEPDPVQDPPDFVALVNEMKDEVNREVGANEDAPEEVTQGDPVQEEAQQEETTQVEQPVSEPPPQPVTQVTTKKKKKGAGRFLLIGAGVAAAGGAAILLAGGGGGGGGGGDVIAEPPPLPN